MLLADPLSSPLAYLAVSRVTVANIPLLLPNKMLIKLRKNIEKIDSAVQITGWHPLQCRPIDQIRHPEPNANPPD